MKYVSVDIETSGLDPERNQVLSIGAIIEDTTKKLPYEKIPKFYKVLNQREITGRPFPLQLNMILIEQLAVYQEGEKTEELKDIVAEPDEVIKLFYDFLYENGLYEYPLPLDEEVRMINGRPYPVFGSKTKPIRINVAGKNYGTFDKLFLEKLPWWQKLIKIRHKIADPGILYVDWDKDDQIPGMDLCKQRAGISGVVTHNALDDAWDVVQLLRKNY